MVRLILAFSVKSMIGRVEIFLKISSDGEESECKEGEWISSSSEGNILEAMNLALNGK